jgi:hypothetical protein
MAFTKKVWANRESEHPTRRMLTPVSGVENTYDISRSEGLVLADGDAFDAATMNDLENRIENADAAIHTSLACVTVSLPASGWTGTSAPYTQTVTVPGMTADWVPGIPMLTSSGVVATDLAMREALSCVSLIESSPSALTFVCYEDKPSADINAKIPGVM